MFSAVFLLLILLYYSEADLQISGSVMIARRVKSLKCISDVNLSRYPGRMVAYHQWNQVYSGGDHFVSNLRAVEALNTQYTLELQKFDNNTNVYSSFSVYNASNGLQHVFNLLIHCSGDKKKKISLVDDDYYRYQADYIITYTSSDSVKFSCLQYLHLSANLLDIQIGWINTAADKIYTYNQTVIRMEPAEVHNGSMLCCLYYTTSAYKNEKHIQRFVKDKTLLIYQKETPNSGGQPSDTTTETYCERESNINIAKISTTTQFITDTSSATGENSNTTNETGKTTGIANKIGINPGTANGTEKNTANINETAKNSKTTNKRKQYTATLNETGNNTGITNKTGISSGTANETFQKSNSTNATDKSTYNTSITNSSDHDADSTVYVIIIISSITATMLLLLVGIYAIKKRCWKKTTRQERAQLPLPQIPGARLRPTNEPDPNTPIHTPFYLNLLFKRECELEIQAREEPHYEEIMYQ